MKLYRNFITLALTLLLTLVFTACETKVTQEETNATTTQNLPTQSTVDTSADGTAAGGTITTSTNGGTTTSSGSSSNDDSASSGGANAGGGSDDHTTNETDDNVTTGGSDNNTSTGETDSNASTDVTAPVITLNGEENLTLVQGTGYIEQGATATDNRDANVSVSISGNVDSATLGSYIMTYTATDTVGNSASIERTVNVVLPPDTEAPVITLNGESNITLTLGESYEELGATAVDERDGDVNVTIKGSVDTTTVSIYTIIYMATDIAGNEATLTRRVTVIDVIPPVITLNGEANVTVVEGDVYEELGATAIDDVDANVSVAISGNVDTLVVGQYTVTYTAIDSAGNRATLTRTVNIVDVTPPNITLNGEANITLEQNAVYTELGATALDGVDGNVSVTITGTVDTSIVGSYTIIYTAQDNAGNESNSTRAITVIDVTPPVITLNGEINSTLEQNAIYTELGATAVDAVDGNVTVEISGNVDTSTVGNYIITYSAVDNASNEANITRTITVIDVTSPVITLNGKANMTLEQNTNYNELGATALDAVDGNVSVTIIGDVDTSIVGSYTIIYTAQDSVGNESNSTRTITVIDVTPPVITLNGEANSTLEYDDIYEELGATATDNSDANVSVEISGMVDTSVEGSHTVTYTATDSSGNTATVIRTVTIEKRIEPPHIVISDELNSTLSENTIPYNRMTLEIPATLTQTLTAINTTLSQEQNRTIRVKGVDNNGTFYLYNIPLIKGTNKIELHAINEIDEEVMQSITINADANQTVPIGMRATEYEGVHSLQTEVEVGTGLDAQEYLFDSNGDGIIDERSTDGNFTVNFTEEGRYKPRVTIRTQNDLLYSSGNYALSLDVKADENQTDPVGAEPIDVAKEFVRALIEDDRDTVETLLMSGNKWLKMLYSNDQRRVNMIEKLKNITNDSWEQNYHPSGAATVTATVYDTGLNQEIPIGFELTPASFDGIPRGHFWFVRAFY